MLHSRFGGRKDYDARFRGPVDGWEYKEATLTAFERKDTTCYLHEYYCTSLRCRALDVLQPTPSPGTGELESAGVEFGDIWAWWEKRLRRGDLELEDSEKSSAWLFAKGKENEKGEGGDEENESAGQEVEHDEGAKREPAEGLDDAAGKDMDGRAVGIAGGKAAEEDGDGWEDQFGELFRPQWELFCAHIKQDFASKELLPEAEWSDMLYGAPDLANLLSTPLMVRIFFDVLPVFLERKQPDRVRQAVFAASEAVAHELFAAPEAVAHKPFAAPEASPHKLWAQLRTGRGVIARLRDTGPAPRLAPVSANASAEEVLAALGKLHEAAAEVGTVRQRVEALLEFSRFALYKEFVRCLILREIRKVRAASAVLGLGRGTQDVECMPVNMSLEESQFEQFHAY